MRSPFSFLPFLFVNPEALRSIGIASEQGSSSGRRRNPLPELSFRESGSPSENRNRIRYIKPKNLLLPSFYLYLFRFIDPEAHWSIVIASETDSCRILYLPPKLSISESGGSPEYRNRIK